MNLNLEQFNQIYGLGLTLGVIKPQPTPPGNVALCYAQVMTAYLKMTAPAMLHTAGLRPESLLEIKLIAATAPGQAAMPGVLVSLRPISCDTGLKYIGTFKGVPVTTHHYQLNSNLGPWFELGVHHFSITVEDIHATGQAEHDPHPMVTWNKMLGNMIRSATGWRDSHLADTEATA